MSGEARDIQTKEKEDKNYSIPVQMAEFGGGDGGKKSYGLSVITYGSHRLAMW